MEADMAQRGLAFLASCVAAFLAFASPSSAQQVGPAPASEVSVALVLAVDVSTSINTERFQLQRRGYAEAFTNPAVISAIQQSPSGRIAVTLVEWAGADSQRVVVPWTEISDAEGGQIFADRLLAEPRPFDGWTSISAAIEFSVQLLETSPYQGARMVIDVSGDGVNNSGRPAAAARDAALARDIAINGLVIMWESAPPVRGLYEPSLEEFYRDNVIGGSGAFVIAINDFDAFAYAIVGKIVREVAALPPDSRFAAIDRREISIAGPGGLRPDRRDAAGGHGHRRVAALRRGPIARGVARPRARPR
jgi:hypothetical protein